MILIYEFFVGDWWMWTMFVTMLILFTAIVFVFCLDDSGPVYR